MKFLCLLKSALAYSDYLEKPLKTKYDSEINRISVAGAEMTEPTQICSAFNDFFTNFEIYLAKILPKSRLHYFSFLGKNSISGDLSFHEIDLSDILSFHEIDSLKENLLTPILTI